ncbi:hypothetical protein [Klebsiella oxytoca]|uniref:hypothetical protein n=1 Tax=Klebsiella oxytoca TaxID=571 RepID=UPI001A8CE7FA|nr:hypothetical protein [Klebsiella oxytoca]MCW9532785.1 hypothetical protein [Klebsiella oxytoca]QSS38234.1 hypothetical protein ISU85_17990 [Klebsiella oxytoca]HEH1525693.1 hypothetical protein [Klebsiella oxytoca]
MTNNQLTDERIKELMHMGRYSHHVVCGREIADICTALEELQERRKAAMDSEPVAYMYRDNLHSDARFSLESKIGNWSPEEINEYEISETLLYRHAQQPVVPDESYQQLSELYHAQEKRLFKIAQRIKGPAFDKYSHSPSQAIDVLEAAIFGEDDASRAAMLSAAQQEAPDGK